ncbi:hypothetical protein [Ammoniphilus sp. YIM 78166]|nr:hypothetical protein [Ammoniphilus sp. YIM 78166]
MNSLLPDTLKEFLDMVKTEDGLQTLIQNLMEEYKKSSFPKEG